MSKEKGKKIIIAEEQIQSALDADIPNINFNGFVNSVGTGDCFIVLQQNGRPVATLNGSYTVIKTLAERLGRMIVTLENTIGSSIYTIDQVQEASIKEKERVKKVIEQ